MQTVETLNEGLRRGYTLTIPAAEIDRRVEAQIRRAAPRINMPGFRPGKVPANLVRKMHGPAMQQEALQEAVSQGVQSLLTDRQLRPAMQPAVELDEAYAPGRDAEVKVSLEVLPVVPAPSIEGLKLERLTVAPEDAAIDEQVARLAGQQKAHEAAPEGHEAAVGDLVVMDYAGSVNGVAFDGGTGEGMSIELGSGRLIPGFEEQLAGVKAGEARTLDVTFPKDYPEKKLAGKAATFAVTVTEVKVAKADAAPDDDFAKSLGLESLEQLRELLKGQVEQELNGLTRTHMKRKLLDQLAASHDFPVPPSMVEAEFQQIWKQLEHEASHEEDQAAATAELEKDRGDYRDIAERRVRLGLLLSEIGSANGVTVTEQEMNRLVAQAAQQYAPQERERFAEYVRQDPMAAAQLRAPLYEDKVVDHLFGTAEITDRAVTRAELEAAIEAEGDEPGTGGHVHGPDCDHDHDAPATAVAASTDAAEAEPAKKPRAKKSKEVTTGTAPEAPAPEVPADVDDAAKPKAKRAARSKASAE